MNICIRLREIILLRTLIGDLHAVDDNVIAAVIQSCEQGLPRSFHDLNLNAELLSDRSGRICVITDHLIGIQIMIGPRCPVSLHAGNQRSLVEDLLQKSVRIGKVHGTGALCFSAFRERRIGLLVRFGRFLCFRLSCCLCFCGCRLSCSGCCIGTASCQQGKGCCCDNDADCLLFHNLPPGNLRTLYPT